MPLYAAFLYTVGPTSLPNVPSTEALQAMLVAADSGSLSAAAAELGLTHGAVSRRIQGLEAWFGQAIFQRHGRGVTLTPAGEIFARRVERSLISIENIAADLRTGTRRDLVRISTLPSFARLWFIPRIVELHGSPADLVIALTCEHRLSAVDAKETDLAIRSGSGEWAGLVSHLMFHDISYPLAAPALAAKLGRATPGDLLNQTLIHDGEAAGWRRWFRSAGETYRPKGGERRFDDYDLALGSAIAGLGVVLSRGPLSDEAERGGALVRLSAHEIATGTGHYLVARPEEQREAVLRLARRILMAASSQPGQSPPAPSTDQRTD
jgi:LysR family glycine cleavage system transcriptional activator